MKTESEYYDVSSTAIKDHSMLGVHGQELCHNLDVHWMTQTCDAGTNNDLDLDRDYLSPPRRICFTRRLFVCLFVCICLSVC